MEKTKLTKDEYLDSLDPDNLKLEKQDLINFCLQWERDSGGGVEITSR